MGRHAVRRAELTPITVCAVSQQWDGMRFAVLPYTKDGEERGFVLTAVDEVLLALDDSTMNLQSMSGSR